MKPSSSNSRSKGHAKARRKTREELDQEARDRKRQKKRRGHAPGSRAAGGNTTSGSKGQNAPKDPRIGSKTPIPLGVTEKVTKRLDALLERLEAGETLSAEEQSWVDAKLDRIDELMQKLGLSYDDDEEEEEDEKQEDMMRLLRGN